MSAGCPRPGVWSCCATAASYRDVQWKGCVTFVEIVSIMFTLFTFSDYSLALQAL